MLTKLIFGLMIYCNSNIGMSQYSGMKTFDSAPLLPRETRNVLFEISKWLVLSHLLATGSLESFLTRNLLSLEGSSGV